MQQKCIRALTPGETRRAQHSPTNADLGRAIRRLRCAHRLSIETLAFTADMHPTYLSRIERGERNPTWLKLCRLAEALERPISTLTRDAEREAEAWTLYLGALRGGPDSGTEGEANM